MAVICLNVNKVLSWDGNYWMTEFIKDMSHKHTYVLIFSAPQKNLLKAFKERFKGTILYESPPAVCHLHPDSPPGNVLILFEWDEGVNPWGKVEKSVKAPVDNLF